MHRLLWQGVLLGVSLLWLCSAARAGSGCGQGEHLSIGVFPRSNPAQIDAMFRPMVELLSAELGCPVELKTASDFSQFWKGIEAQAYDLVHYNQYHYIKSAAAYQVVAHNKEGGSGLIAGAVFVRADSGITELNQLKGKKIVFGGGPDAMMSHIVPRYLLLEAGLAPDDYFFEYAPNPPNAVLAVYFRQAVAAGGGDAVLGVPVLTRSINRDELRIIARSPPVHQLPWTVKRSLPDALKQGIQSALLALPRSGAGRAALKSAGMTGIQEAADSDYDDCRAIVQRVQAVYPVD